MVTAAWCATVERRLEVLEQGQLSKRLCRADRARLSALLPALAGVVGSDVFRAGEVVGSNHPGLRLVLGDATARSLGRLLRRGEGVPVNGHLVQQVGVEAHAALWSVVQVVI